MPVDSVDQSSRHLGATRRAIESSKALLSTVDENGVPVCSRQTWQRATNLLTAFAQHVWERYRVEIDAPEIVPGGEQSIDLYWRRLGYEFVLNVPADPNELISFYGDDKHGAWTKATITSAESPAKQ